MQLIVLSNPAPLPDEASLLEAMFREGLETFHLRKPGMPEKEQETFLRSIPSQFHKHIVLHHYWNLAERFEVKGVHGRGSNTCFPNSAALTRSCSLHSLDEVRQEAHLYNYVFLSPVFNSISKPGYLTPFDRASLTGFLQQMNRQPYPIRIIALGGINSGNLEQVRAMGFSGAALLGALWQHKGADILNTFKQIQRILCQTPVY